MAASPQAQRDSGPAAGEAGRSPAAAGAAPGPGGGPAAGEEEGGHPQEDDGVLEALRAPTGSHGQMPPEEGPPGARLGVQPAWVWDCRVEMGREGLTWTRRCPQSPPVGVCLWRTLKCLVTASPSSGSAGGAVWGGVSASSCVVGQRAPGVGVLPGLPDGPVLPDTRERWNRAAGPSRGAGKGQEGRPHPAPSGPSARAAPTPWGRERLLRAHSTPPRSVV